MPGDVQTVQSIFQLVKDLTLTGALVFILIGGYKGLWVWGYQLRECQKDRDDWKSRSLKSDTLIEWAASIAEAEAQKKQQRRS